MYLARRKYEFNTFDFQIFGLNSKNCPWGEVIALILMLADLYCMFSVLAEDNLAVQHNNVSQPLKYEKPDE